MKYTLGIAGTLAAICVSCLFHAFQQSATDEYNTPVSVRAKGLRIDAAVKNVGVVGLNTKIRERFTITNDSDRDVTLSEPVKSCTCAEAQLERKELKPGESCTLTMVVDTKERRGNRAETVQVQYSYAEAEQRYKVIQLAWVAKGVIEINPLQVQLTKQSPKQMLTISIQDTSKYKILAVRSQHDAVKIDQSQLPNVTLEVDKTVTVESVLQTECVIYTDCPTEREIRVPVRVRE